MFLEASEPNSLALPDKMLFGEFQKCLDDIVLEMFDSLLVDVEVRTMDSFQNLVYNLVEAFCNPTAFADQKRYMDTFKKLFKLSVKQLAN